MFSVASEIHKISATLSFLCNFADVVKAYFALNIQSHSTHI